MAEFMIQGEETAETGGFKGYDLTITPPLGPEEAERVWGMLDAPQSETVYLLGMHGVLSPDQTEEKPICTTLRFLYNPERDSNTIFPDIMKEIAEQLRILKHTVVIK